MGFRRVQLGQTRHLEDSAVSRTAKIERGRVAVPRGSRGVLHTGAARHKVDPMTALRYQ
jgi:hypothetical protein